jgi:hypothetical protein
VFKGGANDTGRVRSSQIMPLWQTCYLWRRAEAFRLLGLKALVVDTMIDLRHRFSFPAICVALLAVQAQADDVIVSWPPGWQVEDLAEAPQASAGQPELLSRQRATRTDEAGKPLLVMELTGSRLQPGHDVNLQGVLLEMRKAIQVNFARTGFLSVCTRPHQAALGGIAAVETRCTITQNGVHVMTQTLVAAASPYSAWSLSYAGSAAAYDDLAEDVSRVRESLKLDAAP